VKAPNSTNTWKPASKQPKSNLQQTALMSNWALEHISASEKILEAKKWLTDEGELAKLVKESEFAFPLCNSLDSFTDFHYKHFAKVAQVRSFEY
jgi:hypothetical protein